MSHFEFCQNGNHISQSAQWYPNNNEPPAADKMNFKKQWIPWSTSHGSWKIKLQARQYRSADVSPDRTTLLIYGSPYNSFNVSIVTNWQTSVYCTAGQNSNKNNNSEVVNPTRKWVVTSSRCLVVTQCTFNIEKRLDKVGQKYTQKLIYLVT